ncbi:MAG TPA: 16S rRNA (guanine(527)-N(7))-methyltransferase RsmG [Alphaproteobacteria bacterium]|nr:16S rRNA (guanine(527)-N(7))-methyltransferase RsmG [Alphaproteobacteria bacterium]
MTTAAPLDPATERLLVERCGVSRETLPRLEAYAAALAKWQPAINLVAPATLPDLWRRHILDSAQLWPLLPAGTASLVDFGSGAGFPGLVLAILGVPQVTLIESDTRKAAFLREAARAAGVAVTVEAKRIEAVPPRPADAVSARALAALSALLPHAAAWLKPGGIALFPKGKTAEDELTAAGKDWTMQVERVPSLTDAAATILRIGGIAKGPLRA